MAVPSTDARRGTCGAPPDGEFIRPRHRATAPSPHINGIAFYQSCRDGHAPRHASRSPSGAWRLSKNRGSGSASHIDGLRLSWSVRAFLFPTHDVGHIHGQIFPKLVALPVRVENGHRVITIHRQWIREDCRLCGPGGGGARRSMVAEGTNTLFFEDWREGL